MITLIIFIDSNSKASEYILFPQNTTTKKK